MKKAYVNIFATYPNHTAFTPPTGNYTVEAPIDQTGKDSPNIKAIKAADLLTTDGMKKFTKEECDVNDKIDLQLKHRMAKLTVTFTPKTGSDLTGSNRNVLASRFPKTLLFAGTREMFYPDIYQLYETLQAMGCDVTLSVGEGMNHVWVVYPIPEGEEAVREIEGFINPEQ